MNWTKHAKLNYIGEITGLSFATDGNGFASAMTLLRDSTILRYTPNGVPPTPGPTWTGNFTQKVCNSGDCAANCTTTSLPQGACLRLTSGGSMTATCDLTNMVIQQKLFILSDACSGPFEEELAPLDECLQGSASTTVELFCGPHSGFPLSDAATKVERAHGIKHRK